MKPVAYDTVRFESEKKIRVRPEDGLISLFSVEGQGCLIDKISVWNPALIS